MFAAMIAGNCALAVGPWLVRIAEHDGGIGPLSSALWRLTIGLPLLLILARGLGQQAERMPASMWGMIAIGGLFFAADLGAWHAGILRTKMANATLFGNATSVVFPIYGFLVARAWPTRDQLLALAMAVAGGALLMGRSFELSPEHFTGDLLCLAAGLLYTGYLVTGGRAREIMPPLPVLIVSTAAGIPALLALALLFGETIWPATWWPVVALAIGSQVFGQGMIMIALGRLSPLVIGLGLLCQPIVGASIGWLVYGERLGVVDLIGAGLVLAALVLVRRPPPGTALPSALHDLSSPS